MAAFSKSSDRASQRRREISPALTCASMNPFQGEREALSRYSIGEKAAPAASPRKKESEGASPPAEWASTPAAAAAVPLGGTTPPTGIKSI